MVRMVQYNTKNNKKGRFRDKFGPREERVRGIGIGKIGHDGTP